MILFRNILVGALVAAGVISGLIFSGSFGFIGVLVLAGLYLLPPILFILLLWGTFILIKRKCLGRSFWLVGQIWCACVFSLFLSGVVSVSSHYYWEIRPIHSFVDRAVPGLKEIKTKTGSYPTQFPISEFGALPHFLRYWGDKDGFSFEYDEQGGNGNTDIFSGPNGGWKEYMN